MNRERLEMLRVMLERVVAGSWQPTDKIDQLRKDVGSYRIGSDVQEIKLKKLDLHDWAKGSATCGFTACAVGHACFDQFFIDAGLKWSGFAPKFGGDTGWSAVQKFFEISSHTANKLFAPDGYSHYVRGQYSEYPTTTREAKMVADRVQKLLDGKSI